MACIIDSPYARYFRIIEAVHAAIDHGIDPMSQEMIGSIRTAVPSADESEIDQALQRNIER